MNIINKYTKNAVTMAIATAGLIMVGCADQPDKYEVAGGRPSVDYIRCLSSEVKGQTDNEETVYTNGQLVTSASPQSTICLVGNNLRSITEIFFNDQKAILNTSYITDNTLIVAIPKNVPKNVSDKIYMVTAAKDTVTYDFTIVIPAPDIISMSNEWAKPGEKATLYGNYFINDPSAPLTIEFEDAEGEPLLASNLKIAEDYSSVSFDVPEGAVEGKVMVTSIYGTSKSPFVYHDTRNMLFDFNGAEDIYNHGWHAQTITTGDDALDGNYMQLGNGTAKLASKGDTWDDDHFHFEYWPGNYADPQTYDAPYDRISDRIDISDYQNMTLKFEMLIPKDKPWSACAMQVIFAPTSLVTNGSEELSVDVFGQPTKGANNTYFHDDNNKIARALYRPWTDTGEYHTDDKWVTVSLPISSSFIYYWDGSKATVPLDKKFFGGLELFVTSGGVVGKDCTPIIKIDNIRLVPNK